MTKEMATQEKEQRGLIEFEVDGEKVKLSPQIVREFLTDNPKVTNQEIMFFMSLARAQKLNPFTKDVYLVKFGDRPAQIITSKEAFMKRAEASELYDGFEAGVVIEQAGELLELKGTIVPKGTELIGGWARVYRKDRKFPVEVQVSLEEFDKKQSTWNVMKATMIRKTAIVNAMREAFPSNLNGLYTEEESQSFEPRQVNGVFEPTPQEQANFDRDAYFEQKKLELEERAASKATTQEPNFHREAEPVGTEEDVTHEYQQGRLEF